MSIQQVEPEGKNARSQIQVISRAADILRLLRESASDLSLGQIAKKVDLPRSTVQRITGALIVEGFVSSAPNGRGLRLGPEFGSFARASHYNIVEHCRLLLSELSQRTGETADLSALRGAGMTFLDQVPGIHRLSTVSKVDEVFPLTTTANGKACLAQLPEDEARSLIQAEWDRTHVVRKMEPIVEDLARVRQSGFAYDLNEHSKGICAIGFAFHDWDNALHAISVPVPSVRFEGVKNDVEDSLADTRSQILNLFPGQNNS